MKSIMPIMMLILLTGCAGVAVNSSQKIQIQPAEALQCIRSVLQQELSDGSSQTYDPAIELTIPFHQCWESLDPIAKRLYAPLLAEAAVEQGSGEILQETCGWVIRYGRETVTGKKCSLLKQAGLEITNLKEVIK